MKVLILAGRNVEEALVSTLLGNVKWVLAHFATVSRGVRLLEKENPQLVMLAPDANDETWVRAIRRIADEFQIPVLMLFAKGGAGEDLAFESGAYDCFELGKSSPEEFTRSLRLLKRQFELEDILAKERKMFDWVEKIGRLGSWERVKDGKTHWSNGVRRIFEDDSGRLNEDFFSVRQFIHPDDLDVYDQANKATFDEGWPLDFEYRIKLENDKNCHLHLHRRVELDAGGGVERAYGMVQDISQQKEFEGFLFRRDAILQVVGAFAGRFLREPEWEDGIDKALREFGKAVDVTRAFIFRKSSEQEDATVMSMKHEWTSSGIEPIIGTAEMQNKRFSPLFDKWRAALQRRKVVIGHVSKFKKNEQTIFKATGAKSILLVPIFVGSEWWGFIGFSERRKERDWLSVEIESLTMVADIFGSAILRRRMEDLLVEANRSAEAAKTIALEASKTKSRFLANMSHEIRTPISGIIGMAEVAITTGLTGEQREHLDMIRSAARSLLLIVNDVLDISKIEADKMELKPKDFEFRTEIETIVRPFMSQAEQEGVVFQYRVSEDVPFYVNGDPDRLGQVLINLVGNSMKFTKRGLIELIVEMADKKAKQICLKFTVRDTGEGIPKDKQGTIFDSFTQADSSVHKKYQGTGLGLTISKELVEMMGGAIGVDSELGRGSIFSFTAWFGAVEGHEIIAEPKPIYVPKPLRLNILLAEDNPLNQKFLTHFLSMFGHSVILAENGSVALEELRKKGRDIDLVLMDIQMPVMGGIEATQCIRGADGKRFDPDIPIIALTAYAMKGDRERMLAVGMNDYISKPVDMKILSATIARNVVNKSEGPIFCSHGTSLGGQDKEDVDGACVEINMESLIERFEGNMELLKEILDLFMAEAAEKLARLDACVKTKNLDELGAALHSITNIASHVLSMAIVKKSRELERMCSLGKTDEVLEGSVELRSCFVALVEAVAERVKEL